MESEKKPPVNGKKLALVIAVAVLAVAVIGLIIWAIARPAPQDETPTNPTAGTEPTTDSLQAPPTDASDPTEPTVDLEAYPVLTRDSYTYEGEDAAALMDEVVATFGSHQLTNGQFAVWYWESYYDMMNYMGAYASMYGLDVNKPLSEQSCVMSQVPMTWEQFLVMQALNTWQSYSALCQAAETAGVVLSEKNQEMLAELETNMATTATRYRFESVDAMIQQDYGTGVTIEDYRAFLNTMILGDQYYQEQMLLKTPTQEDVADYYTENQTNFIAQGVLQDGRPATVDVRHILIQPTGEQVDGSYTTEQMDQARASAQALLDQWKAGEATEDSFAALATEKTQDPGSKDSGGLYEDVSPGQMVAAFNDWCFDTERKPGDTGLVDTNYGVHIMYFVEASETEYWYSQAEAALLSQIQSDWLAGLMEAQTADIHFDKLQLPLVDTATEY